MLFSSVLLLTVGKQLLSHIEVLLLGPIMYQTLYYIYYIPFFTATLNDKDYYPDLTERKMRSREFK